jgi:hypothetical protein
VKVKLREAWDSGKNCFGFFYDFFCNESNTKKRLKHTKSALNSFYSLISELYKFRTRALPVSPLFRLKMYPGTPHFVTYGCPDFD